jgi:hypothetical protein
MPNPFRHFELLLPTKFNSGLPVPNDAFADTLLELEERFGAVSSESQYHWLQRPDLLLLILESGVQENILVCEGRKFVAER